MNAPAILGILLILLGLALFACHSFIDTTAEKPIHLGPIHVRAEKQHSISLPPIIGAVALMRGVVMQIQDRHRS
ncbi:hypothetical protein [Prosthecobacter sp.]|uniref:hypothetical protein n=1 Tax=Prosthecobacter sp. TaxID=1965333 RepID=UPI002489B2E4|nr:hypothetical protein [Prosthecobacter sp.]MDI1315089.1 hypothetical protein [Prosthecobacter sp.]